MCQKKIIIISDTSQMLSIANQVGVGISVYKTGFSNHEEDESSLVDSR